MYLYQIWMHRAPEILNAACLKLFTIFNVFNCLIIKKCFFCQKIFLHSIVILIYWITLNDDWIAAIEYRPIIVSYECAQIWPLQTWDSLLLVDILARFFFSRRHFFLIPSLCPPLFLLLLPALLLCPPTILLPSAPFSLIQHHRALPSGGALQKFFVEPPPTNPVAPGQAVATWGQPSSALQEVLRLAALAYKCRRSLGFLLGPRWNLR